MTIPQTATEPDPFLSLSLIWFRLTDGAYTDPVSLENPDYVHTVALWPGFILMTGTKWEAIETSHGVPGTLLDAFDRALKRDFKICYDQQSLLIERLLSGYKHIAEITIFHEKTRGAEVLLRRLKNSIEETQKDMTLLIAARTEAELGPAAGLIIRQSQALDPHRFPVQLRRLVPKIEKDLTATSTGRKRAASTSQANQCEYCGKVVTEGFATHNISCPAREKSKGVHTKKNTPSSPAAPKKPPSPGGKKGKKK